MEKTRHAILRANCFIHQITIGEYQKAIILFRLPEWNGTAAEVIIDGKHIVGIIQTKAIRTKNQ